MTAFDLVTTAIGKLFTDRNIAAADDYFAPTYIQHSTLAADGIDGLKTLVANLPDGFRYDGVHIIADDQFVVLHGIYHGFGDTPLVAFDIFRVADGKIVEHWDAFTPEVAETASGRSQVDGAVTTDTAADTDANRQLIADFVDQVLSAATTPSSPGSFPRKATPNTTLRLPTASPASVPLPKPGPRTAKTSSTRSCTRLLPRTISCSPGPKAPSGSPWPTTICGASPTAKSWNTGM